MIGRAKLFDSVLIANRGAIATRIARTLTRLGIRSVGVFANSDRSSTHLTAVDEAWSLGDGRAAETYLNADKLFDIIERSGTQAVHPGYGFLAENPQFAERLEQRGVTFVGPTPTHISQFGLKHEARVLARRAGVNLLPGSDLLSSVDEALALARDIGFPLMLKSTAGGGGIGMQRCDDAEQLRSAFARVQRQALANFGNAQLYLEKLIVRARHVEVQAFGDGDGEVLTIGDRDCSLQRRHQKVIEECPAPRLPEAVREALHAQSRALLSSVNYRNAATVEFLYDPQEQAFYFLEVNTRLQVEHGVTELVFNVDLVEWMLRLAAGEMPAFADLPRLNSQGHAVQARIFAEDPNHDFRPTPGVVSHAVFAEHSALRIESWIRAGTEVSPWFDPMLAKVMAKADTREEAISVLREGLQETTLFGLETNREYLIAALQLADFSNATMHTVSLAGLDWRPATIEVLEPGAATTVQSFPGRQGYWAVGMPPSGPMDDLSFRLGNALLGNDSDAAGLEIVVRGPSLRFNTEVTCAVTGAASVITVDDQPVAAWRTFIIKPGQTLTIGTLSDGARAYLLVHGGMIVPETMGSSATFTLGHIGGHQGRTLLTGDTLHVVQGGGCVARAMAEGQRPNYGARKRIRVMLGPHTEPDFFTPEDIDTLLQATWTVHYNSSRTGIRLTGPQPQWAREDGGEAGLHPSNIHDNAYAFGSVDFTGDMPVILGPDGPSLGGFVCPAVVINADRWKLGQLIAGDEIQFTAMTEAGAAVALSKHEAGIGDLCVTTESEEITEREHPVVLGRSNARHSDVIIRRAGQEWLLVEFGPNVLDMELHIKVHVLATLIKDASIPGIVEMTPGIRSLQIRYDTRRWRSSSLVAALQELLAEIEHVGERKIPSRTVWLPLSWDDPACREAVQRYVRGVRDNAPWCPDNIEFIRRINGLASTDDVKQIVFDASYLVMGLGDVYLGAPVATPLDPRHRLVTTKYNPARTWTAENSVGIGGSYLCIYGMEGPGGYQFVGRTLQVWNQHRIGRAFDEY